MIAMPPVPAWYRAIQASYMVVGIAALVVMTLYMTSSEFRYWCFKQQKNLQYQLALARWRMQHGPQVPVPDWVTALREDSELPQEQTSPEP